MKIVWEYSNRARDRTQSKKWSDILLDRRLLAASESSSTAASKKRDRQRLGK